VIENHVSFFVYCHCFLCFQFKLLIEEVEKRRTLFDFENKAKGHKLKQEVRIWDLGFVC